MATLIPSDTPLPPASPTSPAPSARDEAALVPATGSPRGTGAAKAAEGDAVAPRHQATGLISKTERQHLGRLGRQAWDKCGAKGAGIDCDEWRHEQVAIASEGRATCLHDLRRGDYRDVLKHFLVIAGDSARAFRVAQRSGQGAADRDLALYKLREACERGELAFPDYPEAICRRQFRCGLDDLETGKLWFLFYTCTARADAKLKKASLVNSEGGISKTAVVTLEDAPDACNPVGEVGERAL